MTDTQKRVLLVLDRIKEMVANSENDAVVFSEELQAMLADLHEQDFLGADGHCDPRGDWRAGSWSMDRVQGIDGTMEKKQ